MNVPFTLKDAALDEEFLKGAKARGMIQLKGHRSVGGMRASIYNAMPVEGVKALVEYMSEFEAKPWLSQLPDPGAQQHLGQAAWQRLPAERFVAGKDIAKPDAILVRSADMHGMDIPASVLAIGRAGAGTNNIPVKAMSARGVPVFNAPGANANAVKELVLAGMLMAARNLGGAMRFVVRPRSRRSRDGEEGRGRQEDLRRLRTGRPHPGRHRPGQDRLPGGRRGDQARHERASATIRRSPWTRPGACPRR